MNLQAIFSEMKREQYWGNLGPHQTVAHHGDELCTFFNQKDVKEITYSDLVAFVKHLRGKSRKGQNMAGGTVNRYLSMAKLLFKHAAKHMPAWQPPAVPWEEENKTYRQKMLSAEEVARIADALGLVDRVVWLVLNKTGARSGEILGQNLRPEHIDVEGYIELAFTKNGEDRVVWCGPELAEELKRCVEIGSLPQYATFRAHLRQACKKLKIEIPQRLIHSCRHRFCTETASTDMPIDVVMRVTGHKTVTTLMRYRKLSKDVQRKGAKQLAEMMS